MLCTYFFKIKSIESYLKDKNYFKKYKAIPLNDWLEFLNIHLIPDYDLIQ